MPLDLGRQFRDRSTFSIAQIPKAMVAIVKGSAKLRGDCRAFDVGGMGNGHERMI